MILIVMFLLAVAEVLTDGMKRKLSDWWGWVDPTDPAQLGGQINGSLPQFNGSIPPPQLNGTLPPQFGGSLPPQFGGTLPPGYGLRNLWPARLFNFQFDPRGLTAQDIKRFAPPFNRHPQLHTGSVALQCTLMVQFFSFMLIPLYLVILRLPMEEKSSGVSIDTDRKHYGNYMRYLPSFPSTLLCHFFL